MYKQGACGSLRVDTLRHVFYLVFEATLNDIRTILRQNGVPGIGKLDLAVFLYKSCLVFLR